MATQKESAAKKSTSKTATTKAPAKKSATATDGKATTEKAPKASEPKAKAKAPKLSQAMLKEQFLEHIKLNKKRPSSVYNFTKFLDVKSKEFYNFYGSLSKLEKDIWKDLLDSTLTRLAKEPAYAD